MRKLKSDDFASRSSAHNRFHSQGIFIAKAFGWLMEKKRRLFPLIIKQNT